MLEFRTLGTVDLRADDGPLASVLAHPKRVALLAYLAAVHPPRPQRRATLTALLWPELDDAHARGALRQELYLLRRSLGGALAGAGEDTVSYDPERLWCDARAFEAALDDDQGERALELYRGEFLPGLHVDGGEFERWVDEMRGRLARRAVGAARRLAMGSEEAGDLAGALSWVRRLLEVAPYDEPAWRDLIRLLDRSGDRAGALVAYDALVATLRNELEVEPSPETRELLERIRERERAFAPPAAVAGPDGGAPPASEHSPGAVTSDVAEPPPGVDAGRPRRAGGQSGRWGVRRTGRAGDNRRSRRRIVASAAAGAAAIGAALVLATVFRTPASPTRPGPSARPVIQVLAAENQTGEPGFDALGREVTDRLAQGLVGAGFADVVSVAARAVSGPVDLVSGAADVEAGPGRAGVTAVVSATLYRRGELLEVLTRLAEPGVTDRLVEMPGAALFSPTAPHGDALDSLAERVLASVAAHYDPRFEVALSPTRELPIETPSWEAYEQYLEGTELFGRRAFGEAARRMLRAQEIDPGFLKSAIFGALALSMGGRHAEADSVLGAVMAGPGSLRPYERAFAEWVYADLHGQRAAAYRAGAEFARLGPAPQTLFVAGREAFRMNRPREAVRVLQGLDLERGWFRHWTEYWEVLTGALHVLGDHRAELSAALAGRARFPEALTLVQAEIRARAALGQTAEVARLLDEAMTLPPGQITPADVGRTAALELSVHGRESAAANARRSALEWLARQGNGGDGRPSLRTWLLLEGGDLRKSCRTSPPPPAGLDGLGLTGMLAASCGDTAAAHDAIARLEAWSQPYAGGRPLFLAAGIRAALGQPEQAVATLRRAFAAGLAFGVELHASAMVRPLRGREDFEALIRPRE